MKKILTYLLLSVLLYGILGYYPAFLVKQNAVRNGIKKRIKSTVPQNELTVFHFSAIEFSRLEWAEVGREFYLGKSMYDIVKQESNAQGEIVLYCINDIKEKQLFANLDDLVQKNTASQKQTVKIFKLLPAVTNSVNPFRVFLNSEKIITDGNSFLTDSFLKKIPSPPPEFYC